MTGAVRWLRRHWTWNPQVADLQAQVSTLEGVIAGLKDAIANLQSDVVKFEQNRVCRHGELLIAIQRDRGTSDPFVGAVTPSVKLIPNSIPKSGTHLLSAALEAIDGLRIRDEFIPNAKWLGGDCKVELQEGEVIPVDVDIPHYERRYEIEALLSSLRPGESLRGAHVPYSKPLSDLIQRYGIKTFLMVRDPRDIVVSQAHYIQKSSAHPFFSYYSSLRTFDERLMFSITGGPPSMTGFPFQYASIGQRLATMLPWFNTPYTRVIRYEDLLGPAGGGSAERQATAVTAIFDHLGLPSDPEAVRRVAGSAYSTAAPTFRSGRMGDWKAHFTPEHKRAFKDSAGPMLIEYGYETGFDW